MMTAMTQVPVPTTVVTATGGKQGDLNNDGVINAADVVKLVNIIMGG